jgi:hypothetical protein
MAEYGSIGQKEGLWARKNRFQKSCEDKEQFFTEKDCEVRVYRISKRTNEEGLAPYKCEFCGWWHYGHEIGLEKKTNGGIE